MPSKCCSIIILIIGHFSCLKTIISQHPSDRYSKENASCFRSQNDYGNKKRFPGGTVEVRLSLNHGHITDIRFFGDFMSLEPLSPIEDALEGCEYKKEVLYSVLKGFDLKPFFGQISADELIEVLF